MKSVRTRIAPSPTGEDIHIGNLYTALINFAVARKNNGQFIIRIEDTDRTRYREGAESRILSSLKSYGLMYDEGPDIKGPYSPYRQSERLSEYKKYALDLIEKNIAYYCICTKERLEELKSEQVKNNQRTKYDKYCLINQEEVKRKVGQGSSYVIRLNVHPDKMILFNDSLRGEISISSNEIDDQVLLKSDGFPTYHLGVVVDDHLMGITHIIRAEEWISSTPKHVLLYESFGWEMPVFAHLPILRNPDKSKLSKRKNPVWAAWYLEEGYLPEAVLNYLALMGWSHPEGIEFFTLEEFINVFDLKRVNVVGPVFDIKKLSWMNQQYIQNMKDEELVERIVTFYPDDNLDKVLLMKLVPLLKTRMETLKEFKDLTTFFFQVPDSTPRSDKEREVVLDLIQALETVPTWSEQDIFLAFKTLLEKHSLRMPVLYYLLTGKEKGLPLPKTIEIMGKEETLRRLKTLKSA